MDNIKGEMNRAMIHAITTQIEDSDSRNTLLNLCLAFHDVARQLLYKEMHDGFGDQAGDISSLVTRELTDRVRAKLKENKDNVD